MLFPLCRQGGGNNTLPEPIPTTFDNCETFSSAVQLQWTVDISNNEIDFEICSCRSQNSKLVNIMHI